MAENAARQYSNFSTREGIDGSRLTGSFQVAQRDPASLTLFQTHR